MARFEGHEPDVVIIGMAPLCTAAGPGLTPAMEKKLPELARMVIEELEGLGMKAIKKAGHEGQDARTVDRDKPDGDSKKGVQKKRG